MVEFKNVKLNIRNIDISNNISFSIPTNTVTCILGNKNSGKSSILKMLAGVYKNYYGEILIDGVDINYNNNSKIDLVHDSIENDDSITVYQYLQFYGNIYNTMSNNKLIEFIDSMLKRFSLMSYKHTNISQLDKESYKIIDLIRVLINDPDIILFDNLFFSDNIDYNERLLNFIRTFIGKKTLIFVSRSFKYIENICDYLGIIEYGVLIAFDKKEIIYKMADIVSRIEVEVDDDINRAISILNDDNRVTNITYENNLITFSIVDSGYSMTEGKIREIENSVLKCLINNNVKVYSFKKQNIKFSQLFGRLAN